jgi:hypothetical protein
MSSFELPTAVQKVLAQKERRTRPWWRAFRNLPIYWLHQRIRYMDMSERWFHLTLNLILWCVVFWMIGWGEPWWLAAMVSFMIARSLNYIFNDNLWVGLMHSFTFVRNPGWDRMLSYLATSQERMSRCPSIHACALYGGIVRQKFHDKSDLDVRYVRRVGFYNAIAANVCAVRERVIAMLCRIPLDSYVGDSVGFIDKMRDDEIPLVLKDIEGLLLRKYGPTIAVEQTLTNLRKPQCVPS